MKTSNISVEEFEAIADREESHFFDHKAKKIDGRGIQKIAVAFANADGGEFVVGIKDKSEAEDAIDRWDGFSEIEAMNSGLQAVFDIKPAVNVRYELLTCDIAEGYLLRLTIEKSAEVLSTSDGRVVVRHGAQSITIKDPGRIQELAFSKGATSFEDSVLAGLPTELITEAPEVVKFLGDYSPKTDSLEFIINQNLVDYKTWEVRAAAALLFHPVPSAVMPRKCAVKISRYETREDDPEREHLAEQITLEGPLYELISQSAGAVTEMMSKVKVWTADGIGTLEYPPEAVWETVANAIIHRDYSISDDVQIYIFDDRIEIHSPGKLPGYVTVENILDARFSRNPKIVRTLNRYKEPPNKDLGEGLNTTFQKMKEFGLKSPEIFEEGNYVVVRLPHAPLATPGEAIMTFLESHDRITNRQAREITGIKSENLVKIEFYKLRDAGMLEQIPELKGPKSAWRKPS
ncbi:putative DNA binding domain-containing protein [Leisingera sp. S132]|uniref:ATP-binding protein n=1 Tax=Leisingera sp. S132 TaxID=2867016 RepID=UPI0021A36405|nr:ATP-binding protein [Leisingera sp. S132]UWQ78754.1 putative DNA binding domain-containing protein [Leisingera sp. S132]